MGPINFDIRPATDEDLDRIMALEREAFAHGWSSQSWAGQIRDRFTAVGRTVGGIGVVAMSSVADTAELLRIVVAKGARGVGLGRALVRHGLEWAARQGAGEVFLEVSAGNRVAIGLYESCGFSQLDRRADYYGPDDDALVYRRQIPASVEEEICLNR